LRLVSGPLRTTYTRNGDHDEQRTAAIAWLPATER
jgi:hypothetical protein